LVIRKIRLDTQSVPACFMQFGSLLPSHDRLLSKFSGIKPEKGELPAHTGQIFGFPSERKKSRPQDADGV
jgi:hypothetical protein